MTKPIIPEAALAQHIAVLGKTGSGKTYALKGAVVEPLLGAGKHVGIVDPTGAWWGLRSSRDGKSAGFNILVLGGDHGDMPLVASSGAAVARLLVEQGVNLVADTGLMTVGERTRWYIDFATTVYRLNRTPLHLVLDEAHNFAPQGKVPDSETGKMLHATNSLASGGRSRGIRLVFATQRPQKLHKDTLTSADTLIAMRVLAPHDRAAVEDWIKGCGDMAAGKEVLNSLASLPRGTGWVWYPEGGHLQKTAFPAITTFDSSATPADGHAAPAPKGAAKIDLTEIKAALADAVKEAEASDPRALRARIAELEKQVGKPIAAPAPDKATLEAEHWKGVSLGYRLAMEAIARQAGVVIGAAEALFQAAKRVPADLRAAAGAPARPMRLDAKSEAMRDRVERLAKLPPAPRIPPPAAIGNLSKAERLILTALAQYPQGRTKTQVAMLADYAHNGGGFNNAISALRSKGLIIGRGDALQATAEGLGTLGPFDALPTGPELREHWQAREGKAARNILQALFEVYPNGLDKATLATRAGYEANGGGFNNMLSRLRTLELITRGVEIRASEDFFQ